MYEKTSPRSGLRWKPTSKIFKTIGLRRSMRYKERDTLVIVAKYGTSNANWTDSQIDTIADDVYTTFFHEAEPAKDVEDVVKQDVQDVAKTNVDVDQGSRKVKKEDGKNKGKKDQQEVAATDIVDPDTGYLHFLTPLIEINSNASLSELECSSTSELEFPSSNELDSYSSSFDEFDESDESGSLKKSVSHKVPSKDLQKRYEDEVDKDEEKDEKDEEQEDEKDDYDDQLWTPKSIGTSSKSLRTPKSKGTSCKSVPTTKKVVVKSCVPIRNCIIWLANKTTWEMIVNKTFRFQKEHVKKVKEQVRKGKKKLGV
nr:hypothetical protein [Tanacetum cinerariifolium]